MGYNKYGGYLRHSRPFGSKNGYSKDPNYIPVGHPAIGKLVAGGRYIYDKVKNFAGNVWDGSAGAGTGKDRANEAAKREEAYRRISTRNAQKAAKGVKGAMTRARYFGDEANAAGQERKQYEDAYNRSIKGRAEAAGNWIGERARNVRNLFTDQDEREAYLNAWENYANSKGDPNAKKAYEEAQARYQKAYNNPLVKVGNRVRKAANALGGVAGKVGSKIASAAGATRDFMKKSGDTVGNWLKERGRDVRNAFTDQDEREAFEKAAAEFKKDRRNKEASKALSEATNNYARAQNSLLVKGAKAAGKAGEAVRGAGEAIRNAPGNIKNWAKKTGEKIDYAWDGKVGRGSAKDQAEVERFNAGQNARRELHESKIADAYDKSNAQGASLVAKSSRKKAKEARKEAIAGYKRANQYDKEYENSIKGRAEGFINNIFKPKKKKK